MRLCDDTRGALAQADEFFAAENMRWCGADLVRDVEGRWHVVDTTVQWTLHNYSECLFFRSGEPTGKKGNETWDVLIDELEAGAFQ